MAQVTVGKVAKQLQEMERIRNMQSQKAMGTVVIDGFNGMVFWCC